MDVEIVNNWTYTVDKDDIVFHLGDFGNPNLIDALTFKHMFFLPGKTYDDDKTINKLLEGGRVEIIKSDFYYEDIDGHEYRLVHEPESAKDKEFFYLYGHIHKLQMVKRNGLCVSQDSHDFCPISIDTVNFYRNAIENHYDENVFMEQLGK